MFHFDLISLLKIGVKNRLTIMAGRIPWKPDRAIELIPGAHLPELMGLSHYHSLASIILAKELLL